MGKIKLEWGILFGRFGLKAVAVAFIIVFYISHDAPWVPRVGNLGTLIRLLGFYWLLLVVAGSFRFYWLLSGCSLGSASSPWFRQAHHKFFQVCYFGIR